MRLNANATGDSFTFSTAVTSGTYAITVRFAQRNIYGNFQVSVNGTSLGSISGYSSNTSDTWTTVSLGTLALSGNVEFKFVSTGKASAATDFDAKLDYIELTSSTTGAGGASSTGGTTTKGGSTSAGGTTTKGGSTSTGGATTKGGSTSTGGTAATGGTTGSTVVSNAIYVSPTGSASAAGTITAPTTLATAVSRVTAGQTIYLRGGTYALSSTISLTKSGSSSSQIALRAYPLDSARPVLDFSAMSESGSNRGVSLSGSYWYVYGIDVFNAGDNCMYVTGSNNTIEFSTFSECSDTGLQLSGGASNNLVRNCDSYYNADSALENADGFASKLDVGSGNKFVGCRAWNNLDDGWDGYLRGADNVTTTYENCWAIDNGKLKSGAVGAGDGNGFKTGGSDDKALKHNATYTRCIAAGNVNDGFDHNSNRGSVTLLNCAAHNNGSNINFSSTNIAASLKNQEHRLGRDARWTQRH
ncbi:MAG: right-handed parallel beta-helix repeat-containing protein [Polyangiaceae bacterium]